MQPGNLDITIYKGSKFTLNLTWESGGAAVNLTGYTARMQCRADYDSGTAFIEADTVNGYITLGGSAGTISVSIPATITSSIDVEKEGVWDLELIPSSGEANAIRLVMGKVAISKEVTR